MDPFAEHLKDLCLANAAVARAGIEAGQRDGEAVRRVAQHVIAMWERYPEAMLPTPLTAALFALKEQIK